MVWCIHIHIIQSNKLTIHVLSHLSHLLCIHAYSSIGLGLVHHVRACIEDLQETAQDKLMPNIAARKQLVQLRKSMAMLERFNKSLQQVAALDEVCTY